MTKVRTGEIYRLVGTNNRLGIVESIVQIGSIKLIVLYPISSAIYLASDLDFIILEEPCFNSQSMMAESWNLIAIPTACLGENVGRLSDKYLEYFSSFIYFKYQASKNSSLKILTGPTIKNNTDIRLAFREQERDEFSILRDQLITTKEV